MMITLKKLIFLACFVPVVCLTVAVCGAVGATIFFGLASAVGFVAGLEPVGQVVVALLVVASLFNYRDREHKGNM